MPTLRERAASLAREPLVHFLIAGAAVFALLSGRPPDVGERRIVVDEMVVTGLVNRYVEAFRRPPTPAELDDLISDHVRGEVYYREALRLGLDRDDEVVKKRLRNKMLAIAGAEAEAAQPSDAQLQALLAADPARYAAPPLFTLEQRYLGPDSPALRAAAAAEAAALNGGAAPRLAVEAIPVPARFVEAAPLELAERFGDDFAAALTAAPVGRWAGPIVSGLGVHLVRVSARRQPPPPRLADVRQRLENDWRNTAIKAAEQRQLQALMAGYEVVIERPE